MGPAVSPQAQRGQPTQASVVAEDGKRAGTQVTEEEKGQTGERTMSDLVYTAGNTEATFLEPVMSDVKSADFGANDQVDGAGVWPPTSPDPLTDASTD
jgi:hypothetical protein